MTLAIAIILTAFFSFTLGLLAGAMCCAAGKDDERVRVWTYENPDERVRR